MSLSVLHKLSPRQVTLGLNLAVAHCCDLTNASGNGSGDNRASVSPAADNPAAAAAAAASATTAEVPAPASPASSGLPHAVLLYSASTPAELALRRELEALHARQGGWHLPPISAERLPRPAPSTCQSQVVLLCSCLLQARAHGGISLRLHVTSPEWRGRQREWGGKWGRVCRSDLNVALRWLQQQGDSSYALAAAGAAAAAPPGICNGSGASSSSGGAAGAASGLPVEALVCGPGSMENAVIADLSGLGLPAEQTRYERWW